jgi:DNA-binding response OmpR family regulator
VEVSVYATIDGGGNMPKGRILIVEDDREINKLLSGFLTENDYETISVYNGRAASEKMATNNYDLILMDLMLPYKDGKTLIEELREYSDCPVVVLSAKSMMNTRLEVLRIGADDYIMKPFDLKEVLVRIQVVLRRSGSAGRYINGQKEDVLSCGELTFNRNENRVTYGDKNIPLTAKELMLLQLFLEYPNKTYTKANLYEAVWHDDYYYEDNTINVHVSNLRNKLKKATGRDYIETVWGIGYRLKKTDE